MVTLDFSKVAVIADRDTGEDPAAADRAGDREANTQPGDNPSSRFQKKRIKTNDR
jgi:hypothetical protein